MLDLHTHLVGHRDRPATRANIRAFLMKAQKAGLKEIGFSDHDLYWEDLDLELIREVAAEFPLLKVRIGLEVDYRPGAEREIKELLRQFPFDYVIGSVHEIEGWPFDHPGEIAVYRRKVWETLYREYFALVEQAAASGLFTTIGHIDLIKIYGARPVTPVVEIADAALQVIKDKGLAVEINTNGRYKPVGEFYPGIDLLKAICSRQIPITLGSDAHEPEAVGRDLPEVIAQLKALGVTSVVSFEQGRPIRYSL